MRALLLQAWEGVDHVDAIDFDDLGLRYGDMGWDGRWWMVDEMTWLDEMVVVRNEMINEMTW